MSKNIEHVQHLKSKMVVDGSPKLPNPSALTEGEIAVNYAKGYETLSIKNESGDVKSFSSDEYYSSKKLGSGFTGTNSAVTVTEVLDEKQNLLTPGTGIDITNDVISVTGTSMDVDQTIDETTSGSSNPVATKAVYSALTSHTLDESIHFTSGAVQTQIDNSISGKADTSAVTESINVATSGKLDTSTFETYSGNVDTAINGKLSTTDFETYSGAVDTAIGDKLSTIDFNTYSGTVDTEIGNKVDKVDGKELSTNDFTDSYKDKLDSIASGANVNVNADWDASSGDAEILNKPTLGTAAAKGVSNGITNSDNLIEAKHIYSGVGVTIGYDSTTHYIQLKNTSGNVISSFDANDFIVDGMIDSVSAVASGNTTVLDIKWNTDAGSKETIIDIGDMFEADNYYTKSETSGKTEISNALAEKLAISDFNTYSGAVDTTIGSKAAQSDLNTLSGTVTSHTANTNIHLTTTEKTNIDSLATNIAAISGVTSTKVGNWDTAYTNNHTHSNKAALDGITGSVGTMAYENTSSYSSATQVNTALSGKANTATTLNGYGITDAYTKTEVDNKLGSAFTSSSVTEVIESNERVVSQALNDLNTNKQDALTEGRAIDVTNNTISLDLPISAGTGTDSIIEGSSTTASGNYSHAEGSETTASGNYSHAEGIGTKPIGSNSHAEGNSTIASGNWGSHAEGTGTIASGQTSHAEGYYTSGTSNYSHVEGYMTLGSGHGAHAEGCYTKANGGYSHVEGYYTIANNHSEHASGQYNVSSSASTTFGNSGNTLFSVGNGTADYNKHNAFEIRQNGDIYIVSGGTDIKLQDNLDKINPIDLLSLSTSYTFKEKDALCIDGVIYRCTATTDNPPFDFVFDENDSIVYDSINGEEAYVIDNDTLNSGWEVYMNISDRYYSAEIDNRLTNSIGSTNSRLNSHTANTTIHLSSVDITKLETLTRRTRKDFTASGMTYFINTLKSAIADQSLEKYGMKVGDYFTVTHDGKTYNYVIAGLNTMKGTTTPYRLNYNHVGIVVDTNATQAWNVSGNTHQSTYTYATSGGTWTEGAAAGYANCDLHHYLTTTVLTNVKADLGSSNIKSHTKLYSTSVNTSGYNRFGSAGGCSNNWAWYSNQEICALSEVQVYGSTVWSSSGFDTGEACRQLDVFRTYNMNEIFEGRYPWLRDVASASYACFVRNGGHADGDYAYYARCVAALILFA